MSSCTFKCENSSVKTTCTMCTWLFATLYLCFTALLFVRALALTLVLDGTRAKNSVRHCPLHHLVLHALGLKTVSATVLQHLVLHALGLKTASATVLHHLVLHALGLTAPATVPFFLCSTTHSLFFSFSVPLHSIFFSFSVPLHSILL
jgi:hypothetical protein